MDAPSVENRVVVLAVDGSEWSERAFDWYITNVHRDGDRVIVVHSVEPLHPPVIPNAMASPEWKEHLDKHQKKMKDVVAKYESKSKENKLSNATILVVSGDSAGDAICSEAKKAHASLVVMGSRGVGVVRRTFLGSVSSYVVHHAHVPVLVCPKPHQPKKESPQGSPETERKN